MNTPEASSLPTSHSQRKIFGTDGVRGMANVEPVTAETALKLGRSAAHVITQLGAGRAAPISAPRSRWARTPARAATCSKTPWRRD